MADLIQFRRDTAERWAAINPVLAEGEIGLVLGNLYQCKIGDGVTPWNSLPINGFNGNIINELGNNYDAVISQAGLTLILKNIINNTSNVKLSELDNLHKRGDAGWYAICFGKMAIGHMLITSDPMGHTVNQWVFGNFTTDGNQISNTHQDGRHSILVRSYYLGNGSGNLQKNAWTKWRYYQQEFIKSEKDDYSDEGEQWTYGANSIQSMLSALKSTLEEKINNADDVLEFSGIVSGITFQATSLDKYSSDENCSVVYNRDNKVFLLKYIRPFLPATYYNNWRDGDLFGESSANGRVPHGGKIYIDATTNKVYNWIGGTFKLINATAQKGSRGTSENYVYSTGTDADKDCVASCNWWIYSENGRVYVRWKRWGADNNTHYDHDNEEHQTSQYMIPYMGSDNGACYVDGLLPWQWGQRMKDCGEKFRFIREELSTAEYVNLRYLNFSNGGAYDTPISRATSAKAGVMSAADKSKLDSLNNISADGATTAENLCAAVGYKSIFGPKNIFNTNNDTLGGVVSKSVYDSSTLTEYTKGKPFEVFCTQGIKSNVATDKYMIWFGLRKSQTNIERYDCQQVIGISEDDFYRNRNNVAFRLNDGTAYTTHKGSSGLQIDESEGYMLSSEGIIPSYKWFTDTATIEKDGLMSAQDKARLNNLTSYARDLGNFGSEEAALDALKAIEISSNSKIVHVHCTYANGAMSITMMQSIENDYCRQIIFNKSKVFQRAIYFTNGTRKEISHVEDWSCLFGDRLHWDSGENKYVLRQFDLSFNKEHTDPIPTATATNDGLMSSATYNKLATQATEIEKLKQQITSLQERIAKLENK